MTARERAAAQWLRPVPREPVFTCAVCGHRATGSWLAVARSRNTWHAYCRDLSACSARRRAQVQP